MSKQYALVEVKWIDSAWHQGWKTKRDGAVQPSHCKTIGYRVRNTKSHLTVAMSVSTNGNFTEAMCIPRGCVVSVRKLKNGEA